MPSCVCLTSHEGHLTFLRHTIFFPHMLNVNKPFMWKMRKTHMMGLLWILHAKLLSWPPDLCAQSSDFRWSYYFLFFFNIKIMLFWEFSSNLLIHSFLDLNMIVLGFRNKLKSQNIQVRWNSYYLWLCNPARPDRLI